MTKKSSSPAKRTFRVWADDLQRVFQDVDAPSPEEAHRLAHENPDGWEVCDHKYDGIRMSDEVKDLEADEYIVVGTTQFCKTCGSEIVATINESHFREGECGPCEYARYRSQTELLRIARSAANSFKERLSCLRDELREAWADSDDIEDQIGNYEYLLREHKRVIAESEA